MISVSRIVGQWLGLCRKPPVLHTTPVAFIESPATANPTPSGSGGGAGGSGRIGRGIGVLSGSIRTVNREKRLLWFSVLVGLVIVFMFIAHYALHVLGSYPYEMISYPLGLVLTFSIELISVFCFCLILAGLFLNSPSDPADMGGSIRKGLSRAKTHAGALLCWSGFMAVIGTSMVLLVTSAGDLTLSSLITRFPFGYIVTPEVYGQGPIAGLFHIRYASLATIQLMIVNVTLFILTAFVVPVLVLENKPLPAAIGKSTRLFKTIWGEMLVCILLLGMVIIAFSLLSVIFQVIFNAVLLDSPFWYEFYYQGGWRAVAALYMTVWIALVLILATVSGIVIRNLYAYTTTGRIPVVPDANRTQERTG